LPERDTVIQLAHAGPSVLACGAWLKNTVCVTRDDKVYVSQLIGDLGTPEACRMLEQTVVRMCSEYDVQPEIVAHDLHPDFFSTQFAQSYAAERGLPTIAVQHHHAHITALCAEHGITGAVLGLALDGVGLGTDGTVWGGELLQVQGASFERIGHLRLLPLPGGDRATQEPWRMAAAALFKLGRGDEITRRYSAEPAASTVEIMLKRNINCPHTSSMGRVFDAAASLLGLCHKMQFEAQAAIVLEQSAMRYICAHGEPLSLPHGWHITPDGQLDLLPLLMQLVDERDAEYGAALFHTTLVAALAEWVHQVSQQSGIVTLACGGGCFFNKLLAAGLRQYSNACGIYMLSAQTMLPGDSAIALGQAWVAQQYLLQK